MWGIQRPGEFSFRDEHKELGLHKGRTQVQVTLGKDLGALDETLYEWQEEKASKEPELGCKNRRLESCVLLLPHPVHNRWFIVSLSYPPETLNAKVPAFIIFNALIEYLQQN